MRIQSERASGAYYVLKNSVKALHHHAIIEKEYVETPKARAKECKLLLECSKTVAFFCTLFAHFQCQWDIQRIFKGAWIEYELAFSGIFMTVAAWCWHRTKWLITLKLIKFSLIRKWKLCTYFRKMVTFIKWHFFGGTKFAGLVSIRIIYQPYFIKVAISFVPLFHQQVWKNWNGNAEKDDR